MDEYLLKKNKGCKCPSCNNTKDYKLFKLHDHFISDKVGYCPQCGYCLTPFEYKNVQKRIIADFDESRFARQIQEDSHMESNNVPWVLRPDYITASLRDNVFIKYLSSIFSKDLVYQAAAKYGLMSQKKKKDDKWHGAVVFYQYNQEYDKISYKIMQYDENGNRIKKNSNEEIIDGIEERKNNEKDLLNQQSLVEKGKYCLFGLHFLKRPDINEKKVCIVESEKTAIICSIVYPEAIWMASAGCYYLGQDRQNRKINDLYKTIQERKNIILFPDTDVYQTDRDEILGECDWYTMATEKNWLKGVSVNYYILNKYGKTETGHDMADYILDTLNEQHITTPIDTDTIKQLKQEHKLVPFDELITHISVTPSQTPLSGT